MWNFHSFADLIRLCDSTAEKVIISRSTQKGQTVKRLYDRDTGRERLIRTRLIRSST